MTEPLLPPTFMENPRSVTSFSGFTMRICICMPHESRHAAIHFFASHMAANQIPDIRSRAHTIIICSIFFAACRIPHNACCMPHIRIPSLKQKLPSFRSAIFCLCLNWLKKFPIIFNLYQTKENSKNKFLLPLYFQHNTLFFLFFSFLQYCNVNILGNFQGKKENSSMYTKTSPRLRKYK